MLNNFYGEFPKGILCLPNLQYLYVGGNTNLTGSLPEFNQTNSYKQLGLEYTYFYGHLPASIGNLQSLTKLGLNNCKFSGTIPASLGILTQLTHLSLGSNSFTGNILVSIGNLTQLTYLSLFDGEIPSSLANLMQLTFLYLSINQLSGVIPSGLTNMTQLTKLGLSRNLLEGPISSSFSQLQYLSMVDLSANKFSGTVDIDIFLSLIKLSVLGLTGNKIRLLTHHNINSSYPQLTILQLDGCNLLEIPHFLQFQIKLEALFLGGNTINDQVPHWIWNVSDHLLAILLDDNFLTTMEQNPSVLPGITLGVIDINLPVPPSNIISYRILNNRLHGNIPSMICGFKSLQIPDLSNNSMSGLIPDSLGSSLTALDLQGNNFSGKIPQAYPEGCNLMVMDLRQNQLEGELPKSLSNCKMLRQKQ